MSNTMTPTTIKNPTFLVVVSLILTSSLALQACATDHCDTTPREWRTWESLPVTASTDYVYPDLILDAIDRFNSEVGIRAIEFVESDGQIQIFYEDHSDSDTFGTTGIGGAGDIEAANISLAFGLDYEFMVNVLLHEFGHALGHTGHVASGLMYCFTDGSAKDFTDYVNKFKEVYDTNTTE